MCRNHNHLVASFAQGVEFDTGDRVFIVESPIQDVQIECSGGSKLIVPSGLMLLMQPRMPGTPLSSLAHLTAALAALLSVEAMIAFEDGVGMPRQPMNWQPPS